MGDFDPFQVKARFQLVIEKTLRKSCKTRRRDMTHPLTHAVTFNSVSFFNNVEIFQKQNKTKKILTLVGVLVHHGWAMAEVIKSFELYPRRLAKTASPDLNT